jgi:hypothetical protein
MLVERVFAAAKEKISCRLMIKSKWTSLTLARYVFLKNDPTYKIHLFLFPI